MRTRRERNRRKLQLLRSIPNFPVAHLAGRVPLSRTLRSGHDRRLCRTSPSLAGIPDASGLDTA